MMHIDVTMEIVTLEALDVAEIDGVIAVFATASSNVGTNSVQRKDETSGEWHDIPFAAGARSPGGIVLHERHIYEPGEYRLTSAMRKGKVMRAFLITLELLGAKQLKVGILADSTPATWIMGNYDPLKIDGTRVTIHVDNGQIASIEAGEGKDQRRPTAWAHLGDDDL